MAIEKLPAAVGSFPELQSGWNILRTLFPLTGEELGPGSVGPGQITENTLTGNLLVDGTITGDKVATETLTASHIEVGSIDATRLGVEKLSAITADLGTVTVGTLEGVVVKASTFEGNTFKGNTFEGETFKGSTFEGGTITGTTVEGVTVKGSTLEGNTVKGGTLEGGTITGAKIVGGEIMTSESDPRVFMDSGGLTFYNVAHEALVHLDTATGIAFVVAVISSQEGSEIDTTHLAGQITETQIEDGSISTPKLQSNIIEGKHLAVETLGALKSNLGEITAGTLKAVTIEAATITGTTITALEAFQMFEQGGKFAQNELRWYIEETETIDGGISVYRTGSTGHFLELDAYGTKQSARISLYAQDTSLTEAASVRAWANGNWLTLVEASGASSFPQLTEIQKRTVDLKGGNVTLRGTGDTSDFPRLGETAKRTLTLKEDVTLLGTSQVSHFPQLTEDAKRTIDLKGGNVTLLGTGEASDFPQLPETAKRIMNRGTVTLEWSAKSIASASKEITHGLGETPIIVLAGPAQLKGWFVETSSYTSTKATLRAISTTGEQTAGTKLEAVWFAMS